MKTTLILILSSFLLLVACSQEDVSPTEVPTEVTEKITLSISGSGSITPVLESIVEAFEADNPDYILEVLAGSGTGGGVRGTIDGTLDMAAMSRQLKEDEAEQGLEFAQFGTSVTAIMAHPATEVTDLTSEQLADILSGEITNWSEVGGDDVDILVYIRDPEEGNTIHIRETFIGDVEFTDSARLMSSQTDMQNAVTGVQGAIGYGTWATAIANEADLISLSIDEITVDNSPETMTSMMGVGYLGEREDDIQPFIDWLLSEEGQSALETVDVNPVIVTD